MKAVKFLLNKNLDISFDWYTYHFDIDKAYSVDEKLYDFLRVRYPLVFNFNLTDTKKPLVQPKRIKTPVLIRPTQPTQDQSMNYQSSMKIAPASPVPTFSGDDSLLAKDNPDVTPPSGTVDADGVQWYGEGLTKDE